MSTKKPVEEQDLPTLVSGIARDTSTLVGQQMDLLRAELRQEVRKASVGLAEIAAGGGLAAAGGFLSGMMLADLLHRSTRLPLWMCYGIVGGAATAAGASLLKSGSDNITDVQLLPPPESTKTLTENVGWIKEQLTTGPTT